jgi:hypothetical protein
LPHSAQADDESILLSGERCELLATATTQMDFLLTSQPANAIASGSRPRRVIPIPESVTYTPRPRPRNDYRSTPHSSSGTPIVIDNGKYPPLLRPLAYHSAHPAYRCCTCFLPGSSQLRAGWGDEPSPRIVSDQVISKFKDRKANKTILLYGQDTEIDATCRAHQKSIFDRDWLTSTEGIVSLPSLPSQPCRVGWTLMLYGGMLVG